MSEDYKEVEDQALINSLNPFFQEDSNREKGCTKDTWRCTIVDFSKENKDPKAVAANKLLKENKEDENNK